MLSSDGGESEVFFDSVDSLSEDGLALRCEGQMYDIWLNEPQSVMERRQSFLSGMGLAGFSAKSSQCVGLERINECSGAVSSCSISCENVEDENSSGERNSEANAMFDEMEQNCKAQKPNVSFENESSASLPSVQGCEQCEVLKRKKSDASKKKMKRWWKNFVDKRKQRRGACVFDMSESNLEAPKTNRMKVKQNMKKCMELTGLYMGQEIQAHKGFIWTMKFSPDGKYLATGGEDGVVRIWRVTSVDASSKSFTSDDKIGCNLKDGKQKLFAEKKKSPASIVIPEKVFQIEESPLQEFHGHASDILDLAWSNSNCLISSSMDKTVRLWRVGCDHCLNVFRHGDYVTCIQFNPVDEEYFISGSIDGKVRIWGVGEKRVVDWADVRDVISAVCYKPDGKGFIVGSIAGTCRFFDASGNELQLDAEIHMRGKKRNSSNRITGIQFSQEASPRIMITSEDSKVRIFDGIDIVHKFKGLPKSGSQTSASFTSTGRHIISVGEDCRVYVWNYGGSCTPSSKQIRSVRTCEHFFSEGVSVALPWPGMGTEARDLSSSRHHHHGRLTQIEEGVSCRRDSERFSLGSWFFMDGACRGSSATWPEEKLPLWDAPIEGADECENQYSEDLEQQNLIDTNDHTPLSEAWGLNIVTAGWDGKLRTFHNYGLPIRI